MTRDHDYGFFVWSVPSFLIVFGGVTGFSIGLPILALGLVLFTYLHWRGPIWPADLGLIAGAGLASLVFAAIAAISGDYSAHPWSEIGLGLVAASSALFWWLRCRPVQPSAE